MTDGLGPRGRVDNEAALMYPSGSSQRNDDQCEEHEKCDTEQHSQDPSSAEHQHLQSTSL